MGLRVVLSSLLLGFALACAPAYAETPKSPAEAAIQAEPLVDAARKAASAATPEMVKDLRRALDLMQAQLSSASVEKEPWFSKLWNEALTLSRFHGGKPTAPYLMEQHKAVANRIAFGLPYGRTWRFEPSTPRPDDQLWGVVSRRNSSGGNACEMKIWVYSFNVIYSDIGGENAKGMAERDLQNDRYGVTKVVSRSPRVLAKSLGKFARAHYYEVIGEDEKEGLVRRRNYYVKGSTHTYNFEVIEYRKPVALDLPVDAWRQGVTDPELEAVLDSVQELEPEKQKGK